MKKIWTVVVGLVLMLSLLTIGAFTLSANAATSGDYTYSVSGGNATITDYTGSATTLTIPSTLGGYPVTSIGYDAFYNCDSLTSVTIGNSVTSIGYEAFSDCDSLANITVEENNPRYCSVNGVLFNKDKTTLLAYPAGKTASSYTIPNSVTSIGDCAFYGCSSLTSIAFPDSVTSVGAGAFYKCNALEAVYISDLASWCQCDFLDSAYASDAVVSTNPLSDKCRLYLNGELLTNAIIPDGVTSIKAYAFANCTSLASITIPNSVTSVDKYAFSGCNALEAVYISDLASWCQCSFTDYEYLAGDATIVSTNPLSDKCKLYLNGELLTNAIIPDGVTSIEAYAFANCTSLTSVTILDGVTTIGKEAFANCISLTSIVIPNSVTSIGEKAFFGCTSLIDMTVPFVGASRSASGSSGVFGYIFGYTLSSGTQGTVQQHYSYGYYHNYYIPSSLRSVVVTDATKIPYGAFYNCSMLISITIPNSVTSIENNAFRNCNSLPSITIPDSVTSIGSDAFRDCPLMTSITIPDSVTSIGKRAFSYCKSLDSVIIYSSTAKIDNIGLPSSTVIYCKADSAAEKYCSSNDRPFAYIDGTEEEMIVGGEIGKFIWTLDKRTGVLELIGSGKMIDFSTVTAPWYGYRYFITSVILPDGLTNIGKKAFFNCPRLTSISIPDSVTSIGNAAFYKCRYLHSITIPSGVKAIGTYAFYQCISLTSATITDGVTNIGNDAFCGCSSLTSITIPDSVVSIGSSAFEDCTSLISVSIGDCVQSIEPWTFGNCTSLSMVTIGNSVASIGDSAFRNCTSLASITIPNSARSIGLRAFQDCTALSAIYIPDGVKIIGYESFYNCSSLVSLVLPYSVISISNYAFRDCDSLESVTIYNKDCQFSSNCGLNYHHTLYGYKGSTTEIFAEENGSKFMDVETTHTHTYSSDCDKKCSSCGTPRTVLHTYKNVVTKATLSKDGKINYQCTKCGYVSSKSTVVKRPTSFKLSTTTYTYNGSVKTPTVTVKDSAGKVLKKNTDYTVTYASGRKNVGTYKVTVKMKGNYTGTKTLTFKINPINVSKCKLSLSTTSYTYNGSVKTPSVTVKNASGTKLTKDTHYTVTYASGRKNVGSYKVTIKMKGNYTGTKTLTFKINPAKTTVSKVTSPKVKMLKITVTKKTTQVTGYQVQYSTSKSFKSATTKTLTKNTTTSATMTGLKAKTTYYVRVRTYKTVNGAKYYSGWSTAKSAKTK